MSADIFPIAPVLDKTGWAAFGFEIFCIVMTLFFIGAMGFAWTTVRSLRHAEFQLADHELQVRCFPFSRTYPYTALDLQAALVTDTQTHPEFKPTSRKAGTALGTIKGGWYRLRNGDKALLYLTRGEEAVVIPTRNGHTLLLSPQDPTGFLERLRQRAGAVPDGA
ncbi:PH domain-containing protein [Megalodesulfovibrio paquesii]